MSLFIFIVILVALIWVHELGHFTAAKLFGIRVDEFSIGFPPRLLCVQWGETRYSLNLLLVGGYVLIHGEDPGTDAHDKRSLASRSRFVQALVIVAGVAMNLIFGGVMLSAGDTIQTLTTGTARLDAAGETAAGVQEFIAAHSNESFVFSITRDGKAQNFVLRAEDGIVDGRKAVGIQMNDVGLLQLPPHLALIEGARAAKDMTISTAVGLGTFFGELARGKAQWDQVAGPVGIAGAGASAVGKGFASAAVITALISINLALINLIPIPGLDGGRLLIIAVEGVIRRRISPKIITGLSLAGFALLIALMLLVTYHDVAKLVG